MQEERFSLGENSNRMVTVMPFNANHIRQFYVNENGEMKASRIGITLSVEEFNELVKLTPKIQNSIRQYKSHHIGPSPPPPLIDLDKILTDLSPKKNSRDIIKILLLMNICMVQQWIEKQELLNMTIH